MKKLLSFSLFTLFFIFIQQGCKKYNEEEMINEGILCSADTIRFSEHVLPIIQNNCLPCHSSEEQKGNTILETYNDITNYTLNGSLLGVIRHESGYSPMPQDAPKLSDCKIRAIEVWIAQGAMNN